MCMYDSKEGGAQYLDLSSIVFMGWCLLVFCDFKDMKIQVHFC